MVVAGSGSSGSTSRCCGRCHCIPMGGAIFKRCKVNIDYHVGVSGGFDRVASTLA